MKRKREHNLNTGVVQEPKNVDQTFQIDYSYEREKMGMRELNGMILGLKQVFKFLEIKDRVCASKVCSSWNMILKDHSLWKYVNLRNSQVHDWEHLIHSVNTHGSTALNCRRMLLPGNLQDLDKFWANFTLAIKKATNLHELELYRCPINVVHECIQALPQLSKLDATSIKNLHESNVVDDFKSINLNSVNRMINLTHLSIKGLTGIKLEPSLTLTFENLNKLHTLSLTSIKSFPKDICLYLETVTTSLEHLEIGDCEYISDNFPKLIKRFTNLKMLRLENCCGRWQYFAKEVFFEIRSLKKLKILELVNIEFTDCVEEELGNCTGVDSLLIIPLYLSQSATINRKLIDCLKKFSKTLKFLVWGLTRELLDKTDIFINLFQQNQPTQHYRIDTSQASSDPFNNIPILGRSEEYEVDIFSVPNIQNVLEKMIVNAKIKIIKVPFSGTNRVHIQEYFNEIKCVLNKKN